RVELADVELEPVGKRKADRPVACSRQGDAEPPVLGSLRDTEAGFQGHERRSLIEDARSPFAELDAERRLLRFVTGAAGDDAGSDEGQRQTSHDSSYRHATSVT